MKIFITRHGESIYNTEDRIGGNSRLTEEGKKYAKNLSKLYEENFDKFPKKCFVSTKIRCVETCEYLTHYLNDISFNPDLQEINAGIAENLTYSNFEKIYPEEYTNRKKDKFSYKYPNGESYKDLIERTRKFCDNVKEENKDILIISHRAIIRTLIFHFTTNVKEDDVPNIDIPLHTILIVEDDKINKICIT